MPDRPPQHQFTPEQVSDLKEFADNMRAARRLWKIIIWVALGISGLVGFAYAVLGVATSWRVLHPK